MRPSRLIGLQQQHHGRAVRVFFIDEAQGFDQHVRFVNIGFEQLLRRFMAYEITLEIAACRMDDLLRGKRPTGMATHAIPSKIGKRRVGKECRSRWSPYH